MRIPRGLVGPGALGWVQSFSFVPGYFDFLNHAGVGDVHVSGNRLSQE
jgi:hypothetical protein